MIDLAQLKVRAEQQLNARDYIGVDPDTVLALIAAVERAQTVSAVLDNAVQEGAARYDVAYTHLAAALAPFSVGDGEG